MKKLQTIVPVLCFAIPGLLGIGWLEQYSYFAAYESLWAVIDTAVSAIAISAGIILLYTRKSK